MHIEQLVELHFILFVFVIWQSKGDMLTDCIKETNPSRGDIASFLNKELPGTDKGKLLPNGKFNGEEGNKLADRLYPNDIVRNGKVKHVLSHCGAVVSNVMNKCKLAFKLAECSTNLSNTLNL